MLKKKKHYFEKRVNVNEIVILQDFEYSMNINRESTSHDIIISRYSFDLSTQRFDNNLIICLNFKLIEIQ